MSTPTTTPDRQLITARQQALAQSGWGTPFRLVQPHNLAFWVWAAFVVYGTVLLAQMVAQEAAVYGGAFGVGGLIFAIYAALWWAFFRHLDRYERLPFMLLVAAFLWGGLAAPWVLAMSGNTALSGIYGKEISQVFVTDWSAALSAPFVEETAKGIGFLLLLTMAPQIIRSPRAAILVGAYVGLGFEVFEDVLYGAIGSTQSFNVDPVSSALHMAALRIPTGLFSHALYCALFSLGVLYIVGTPAVPRRAGRGIAFIIGAMLLHGVWDGASAIGNGGAATLLALIAVAVASTIGLWYAFHLAAPTEQRWMRDLMTPEVQNGTITPAELEALAGRRKQRRAYRKSEHGHHSKRTAVHVLEAAADLAHELATAHGEPTPDVDHARDEIARLRAS